MTALPPVITNSVDEPKNRNRDTTRMNVVPRRQLLAVLLPCLSLWLMLLHADTAMAAEGACPGSTENKTVSLEVIEAFILNRHGSDWVAQAHEYSAAAAALQSQEGETNTNTHDFGQNCENGGETAAVGEIVCTVSGAEDSVSFQEDCTEATVNGYYVTYNLTILCSNVDGAGQDDNVDSVTYHYLHQNLCIPPICSEEQVENELDQAADYYAGTFAEALEGSHCVVDSLAITSGAAVGKAVMMALMLTVGLSSGVLVVMTSLL